MNEQLIDDLDFAILECLLENAALTYKEIGSKIHLTGQAVGARVRKMEEQGIIEGYTLRWNPEKIGQSVHAFITVFMKSSSAHPAFLDFVKKHKEIKETHRVSGEGCYWLRVRVCGSEELNHLLNKILQYGNYKLSLSIDQVK